MAASQVSPFSFGSHAVRVVVREGNPWFVATDVCSALGYVNTSKAVGDHLDEDERSHEQLDRSRMGSKAVIINESGLYALVLRSRKPEARKFAKWVTSEVLPAIRKTGRYEATPPSTSHRAKPPASQLPLLPPPRRIRSRDDLSFTKRDADGGLINWFMPDRENNWHEHYGIGEIWFEEIVELARNDPKEAYDAMRFAGQEMIRYWNHGHPEGFFDRMSRWALTAILSNPSGPQLPFNPPCLGIPPREGMEFHIASAAPSLALTPAEQDAIDKQAWQEAAECQRHCYNRRRYELAVRHA